MFILVKPRAQAAGYRLDVLGETPHTMLRPVWLFRDLLWAGGHGIAVFKGNYEAPIAGVTVVSRKGTPKEQLALTAETPHACYYAAPTSIADGEMSVSLLVTFEDGMNALQENVENLSLVWPEREPTDAAIPVSTTEVHAGSASLGVPRNWRGKARTHVAYFRGSMDATDAIQLLEKPGVLQDGIGSDPHFFAFLVEWVPRDTSEADLRIHADFLDRAITGIRTASG